MIIKPAPPIISDKASHKCAVPMDICLAPASIECEEGIAERGLSSWLRSALRS